MNESIADIERGSRAFWARLLRERFGRDVTLEVEWEAFVAASLRDGWVLYPVNIQHAGIERLLYALTGFMDDDEAFKTAAIHDINSLHICSAADADAVDLSLRKGRLAYHCFAGDRDGYYTIDEIKKLLAHRMPRKTKVRRGLETWFRGLGDDDGREVEESASVLAKQPLEEPRTDGTELDLPTFHEGPPLQSDAPVQDEQENALDEYDTSLRGELEAVYDGFINAIEERDLGGLLSRVDLSRTDEETLRKEMASDGFVGFSEWMQTVYPHLEQATFISLKSEDEDLAGYYMTWISPYSKDDLFLTLVRFQEIGGRWKMLFRLSETASAMVEVREGQDTMAEAREVMRTHPLMKLKRPEAPYAPAPAREESERGLSEDRARLKGELEAALRSLYGALERRDLDAFMSACVLSKDDEQKLRKKFKNLSGEILAHTPDPSKATFVKVQTRGEDQAGYYFVAPFPQRPTFDFVYLRTFLFRGGRWRIVFSLEHELAMNMSIARSGGDLVSRAVEVIDRIGLLDFEWVMSSLFEEIVGGELWD